MPESAGSATLSPLILLAHADEIARRALESVITQGGYRVLMASSADSVFAQARAIRPDGIILDIGLARPHNFSVCRALRSDPAVSLATPIILITRGRATRSEQLDALRAGAWELRGEPLDAEELLLRLAAYVQGKMEVDRMGSEGMVDRASGLYNAAGVARRAEELASLSARQGMALACVVFRTAGEAPSHDYGDRLAVAFRDAGRISDAIGRLGPTEFAVFAPATDESAAKKLVTRLVVKVSQAVNGKSKGTPLLAGVSTAPPAPRFHPLELLAEARKSAAP
jgi:PleD family two-component response regulator